MSRPRLSLLLRQFSSGASATDYYVQVPNRAVLGVSGRDATKFLQGLITNHMGRVELGGRGFYSAMLTPNGRMMGDIFVYPRNRPVFVPSSPRYLVECDAGLAQQVTKLLKVYRVRASVQIEDVSSQYAPWQIWGKHVHAALKSLAGSGNLDAWCIDPRASGALGMRVLLPRSGAGPQLPASFMQVSAAEYTARRLVYGVPEGSEDLLVGKSLPLESNFDYMNGIDFRKGCYLGQELTIRTYHTGIVRKRMVPFVAIPRQRISRLASEPLRNVLTDSANHDSISIDQTLSQPLIASRSDLYKVTLGQVLESSGELALPSKPAASAGSTLYNTGLALIRLEHITDAARHLFTEESTAATLTADSPVFVTKGHGDAVVIPYIPRWWPQSSQPASQA
ncbi:Aminomethyltransferase folate-binding domain-containing protein [Ramicandelaber brevisporus]|nr:Aminomethyltransferase folate-binding domain-containing protein [Ramicandelaber brevisporus]